MRALIAARAEHYLAIYIGLAHAYDVAVVVVVVFIEWGLVWGGMRTGEIGLWLCLLYGRHTWRSAAPAEMLCAVCGVTERVCVCAITDTRVRDLCAHIHIAQASAMH